MMFPIAVRHAARGLDHAHPCALVDDEIAQKASSVERRAA